MIRINVDVIVIVSLLWTATGMYADDDSNGGLRILSRVNLEKKDSTGHGQQEQTERELSVLRSPYQTRSSSRYSTQSYWYHAHQSHYSAKSSKHSKSKGEGNGKGYYYPSKSKSAKHSKSKGKGYYYRSKSKSTKHSKSECKLATAIETREKCRQIQSNPLPFCVGIRGNGAKLWAHFTALARAIETFGPVSGVAGGSSATLVAFIFESIQSNPLVLDCGVNGCCSGMEQRARISFLLKSVQAVPSASIIWPTVALENILKQTQEQEILPRLMSNDSTLQDAAIQDLLEILTQEDLTSLVNPDLIDLLQNSPDPVFHALDILEASTRNFVIGDDPLVFIRPYILSFPGLAEVVDNIASFYSGLEPVDNNAMETMLKECAASSVGKDWNAIESVATPGGQTCGELFSSLFQAFLTRRDSSHPTRLDDPLGGSLKSLITTAVLRGEALNIWEKATEDYFNAIVPVDFNVDFNDVSFGYFGDQESLNRVKWKLPTLFSDLKSTKFLSLGQATWRYVLERSPAEPTLSRGVPIGDKMVSVGGWPDPTPAQVLTAMGCDRVVLLNKPDGASGFIKDIPGALGASPEMVNDLYSLEDKESSFVTALREADASYCADWDDPSISLSDFDAIADTGNAAPLLSDDPCILSLAGEATDVDIVGCTA
jgi:hypothetical protein